VKLRGADFLARTLAAVGARHVFTLSGNHVMSVFDAALDAKLGLVHVRHEAAAVHMADAWGRLTGEPGIALVTGGPGHANAVGALYTALAADSPLVHGRVAVDRQRVLERRDDELVGVEERSVEVEERGAVGHGTLPGKGRAARRALSGMRAGRRGPGRWPPRRP